MKEMVLSIEYYQKQKYRESPDKAGMCTGLGSRRGVNPCLLNLFPFLLLRRCLSIVFLENPSYLRKDLDHIIFEGFLVLLFFLKV